MIKEIYLMGSTGSIGINTLDIIRNDKNKFKIKLLTTNKNIKKIYYQAIEFDVKNIIIFDKEAYFKYHKNFKATHI